MRARKARMEVPFRGAGSCWSGKVMRALRAHQEEPEVRALCLERTQDRRYGVGC
jgi:hypothetical protein